ncbi:hypothetical protein EON81_26985, partial [bacterium]
MKRYLIESPEIDDRAGLFEKEWMLADGAGGYAMGTVAGACTRRYHGLFIPSLNPPADRRVLVKAIECFLETAEGSIGLSCNRYRNAVYPEGHLYLHSFSVGESAVWTYRVGGSVIERELALNAGTAEVRYRNLGASRIRLRLQPLLVNRDHHGEQHASDEADFSLLKIEPSPDWKREEDACWHYGFTHDEEARRSLATEEDAYRPFSLLADLEPGESQTVRFSVPSLSFPTQTTTGVSADDEFLEAAQRFLVRSRDRTTILAGYPWFSDWGRDTMISLPGTLLAAGRVEEARQTILGYARAMRNGLIPNRFSDDGKGADYNTADGTLW